MAASTYVHKAAIYTATLGTTGDYFRLATTGANARAYRYDAIEFFNMSGTSTCWVNVVGSTSKSVTSGNIPVPARTSVTIAYTTKINAIASANSTPVSVRGVSRGLIG